MLSRDVPLFSVCIPCFNHERYIAKTIQSILDQDFEDFEIVVADNASTDNSREVVRSIRDRRIRLITNRWNIGFAPNLQQVTRHARGRFLNLLSSDDIMNAGALRTYADLIARYRGHAQGLVLMSQNWDIDAEDRVIAYVAHRPDRLGPVRVQIPTQQQIDAQYHHETHQGFEMFASCMRYFETAGNFCSVTYARELWEAVEGYNSTQLFNPDRHFILKVLRLDPLIVCVNRPLYSYRKHDMGQMGQLRREVSLKFELDEYNYLLQYDDQWLRGTGVSRGDQRRIFVTRDCLNRALVRLAEGEWTSASRLLAFAWATYPGVLARQPKAWVLVALLAGGPVGIAVSRALYLVFKSRRRALPPLWEVVQVSAGERSAGRAESPARAMR